MAKFVCRNFTPYSIRLCFLQVNVNSIPKKHATIWLKDIYLLVSGSKSELMLTFIQSIFGMWSSCNTFWTYELSTSRNCCQKKPRSYYLCHTRFHPRAVQKHFSISSYNRCEFFFNIELFEVGPQEIILGMDVRWSWRPALSIDDALWKSVVRDRAAKYNTRNVQDDVVCV